MSVHSGQPTSIVININDGHRGHSAATDAAMSPRVSAGENFQNVGADPHQAHREWPKLWANFLRTSFAGPMMVERICLQFAVNERTVRNWLKGEGGCNGRHVLVAMQHDSATAMDTLFHMAAE